MKYFYDIVELSVQSGWNCFCVMMVMIGATVCAMAVTWMLEGLIETVIKAVKK